MRAPVIAISLALLVASACTAGSSLTRQEFDSDVRTAVSSTLTAIDAERYEDAVATEVVLAGLRVEPTPSPVPTPTWTPTPSPTLVPQPTATVMPTQAPSPTPSPSPAPTATPAPSPTPAPVELTPAELSQEFGASVVRIETDFGTGSGIIISVDDKGKALILTNQHVVEKVSRADEVQISIRDSDVYQSIALTKDITRDLALVGVCCDTTLEPLEFADMGDFRPGTSVVALGYPLGSQTLRISTGIVSGIDSNDFRDRVEVQTDAAINPGNSGGPLMLLDGTVAGINTAVLRTLSDGTIVEGVGFAVSAETISRVVPSLLGGRAQPVLSPQPSDPALDDGAYIDDEYEYRLEVPPGWVVNSSGENSVVFYPFVSDVYVRVEVIQTTAEESGGSVIGFRNHYTLGGAPEWEYFYIYLQESFIREPWMNPETRDPVIGWHFQFTYSYFGEDYTGRTDWFYRAIGNEHYIYSVTMQFPLDVKDTPNGKQARAIFDSFQMP